MVKWREKKVEKDTAGQMCYVREEGESIILAHRHLEAR